MRYLNQFNIPFQGHAGFVPSQTTWIGGVKAFGKNIEEAKKLYEQINIIQDAGAWAIEVECVPEKILSEINKKINILTISIGSGKDSDVQFLFAEDILGYSLIETPRHAKVYRNFNELHKKLQTERISAFKEFRRDVSKNKFPSKNNTISIDKKNFDLFKKFLNKD